MQKFLTSVLCSLLVVGAAAQQKKVKPTASSKQASVSQLIENYQFSDAITSINRSIQSARRKNLPTDSLENLLLQVNNAENMLTSTEQVIFIDSVVVDKNKILDIYKISNDAGKIDLFKNVFRNANTDDEVRYSYTYTPQFLDKIYYSDRSKEGLYLYTRDNLDDSWGEARKVPGLEDFGSNQISPFELSDGATLYFAATGDESIGGYDIFMTRYSQDEGKFLKPENIGMPFNSPANDYLYAIDETSNLGWFVSDRRQPEGKACIYVFIPNDTRTNYTLEPGPQLASFSKINSIKDTWNGETGKVNEAMTRLQNLYTETKATQTKEAFNFVVNDNKTCTSLNDFSNAKARSHAKQWDEARKLYDSQALTLQQKRDQYSQSGANKQALASDILSLEKKQEKLIQDIANLEKTIRSEELQKQ